VELKLPRKNPTLQYERLRETAVRARLPYDKDVWLNLSFYLDEQYVEWADDASTIRRIPRRPGFEYTPRPVANKIMHFVAQEHAMALQTKPTVDVLPATDDPVDFSNAAVSLAYLRWLTEPQVADFDGELSDAVLWALSASEGFLKWTYNPRLDRPDVTSVSPLDLYIDPYCKRFKHARWAIHSQFMDVEQVYDIYGKEIKATDLQKADVLKTQLMREMGCAPALQGALVNELWMKPNRRHPEGLYVVWAGRDVLVEPGKFPYAHGRLPFTQVGSIPRPGSPHYTCAPKYLRSGQMELNKYHSQKIMSREGFVNYKWWIPNELELNEQPNDSPRQVLRGHSEGGTLKPEILVPPALPDNGDGQWISDEMMHVAGIHEVSQAQVPGRVEAARAIETLKEADAGRLAELHRTIKSSIAEGFWMCLMLAKQYVSEEQMVQTYSRDGLPEVKHFKAEDIKPGTKVQVTMTTGLARSRAQREQQLLELWDREIITDPEVFADLMEVPISTFTPAKAHDIRLARNENFVLVEGKPIVPNAWDDHELHLREHNAFRKTTEFLTLSTEVKTMFEHHCEAHDILQMQQLEKLGMKQALMQQFMQPVTAGPGGTEAPSQPPQATAA